MDGRALRAKPDRQVDPYGAKLDPIQAQALQDLVKALAELSRLLVATEPLFGPYQPVPPTRAHLRSRI